MDSLDIGALNRAITAHCLAFLEELQRRRKNLTADELCGLKNPYVRYEGGVPAAEVYFFTVDGTLNGVLHKGCIFAGQPMIVNASSLERAREIAETGMRDTVALLFEHYMRRTQEEAGEIMGSGRRYREANGEPLATDPRLRDIIATEIGGLPWKN